MSHDVAVLGVGMHPWGKWGRPIRRVRRCGCARSASGRQCRLERRGIHRRRSDRAQRLRGLCCRLDVRPRPWLERQSRRDLLRGVRLGLCCDRGGADEDLAGLCDVALVVGADTTPKGFLAPNSGERWDDPDWLRFRLVGATNPTYFGLYARRRMDLYGTTVADFAAVKVKNSKHGLHNENARYRKAVSHEEMAASPVVADPLRLLDICATSDGGAAVVLASMEYARRHSLEPVRIRAVSTVTPKYPNTVLDMPDLATDSAMIAPPPARSFKSSIAHAAYEEAGIGPLELSVAEVYDLSTALELDWYEDIGLCEAGDAEKLLHDGATTIGGSIPVNVSGGLASFGEAVPAQAIAQVCEITWQLRGTAGPRQVEGARVGITANQGLFGHGSAVLLSK